jgi:hypothetical protein
MSGETDVNALKAPVRLSPEWNFLFFFERVSADE